MKINFVDIKKQYNKMKSEIDSAVLSVMSNGQFIMGQDVFDLEYNLSNYTESEYAISCSSGTDALLLALMSLNIRPGDEIITTPFTFISTVEVILLLKAKPIFVDIREDTFNINEELIERAITKKTKAIIPVSLFGQTSDMDSINSIAKKYSLKVIEDAAQSFGAIYKKEKSCNISDIACTSFFPAKPLGCFGDGGAIFTNNQDLAEKMVSLRNHGQISKYNYAYTGINGRMDTIQAAILNIKLKYFDKEIVLRNKVAKIYNNILCDLELKTPFIEDYCISVFAQYSILTNKRDSIIKHFKEKNIPYGIYYPKPLHLTGCCDHMEHSVGDFPISEDISKKIISLPMHPYLQEDEQNYICNVLKDAII
tara:strand:- start:2129 stop:3229 length:1101 start_codon:yes stop_codon:yes gene_type:complete